MDEDQSESPPALINGSSVDTDSSSCERTPDSKDLDELPTVSSPPRLDKSPLLPISLPKLTDAITSSMSSLGGDSRNQLKLPLVLNTKRKQQTLCVDGNRATPARASVSDTTQLPEVIDSDDKQGSKISDSPLSSSSVTKSYASSDSEVREKAAAAVLQQPPTLSGGRQLQQDRQGLSGAESTTCTEEDDDDDADVIEVESEVDIPVGGGGEGVGKVSDTPSSDDEWDESLLPPR